jgi:hypothetical protein
MRRKSISPILGHSQIWRSVLVGAVQTRNGSTAMLLDEAGVAVVGADGVAAVAVRSETAIPSFSSSAWISGALRRLSAVMRG